MTTTNRIARTEQIATRRLFWVGPLTIASAVVLNLLARWLLGLVITVRPDFEPLQYGSIAVFTAIGVLGAVLVFAAIARFSQSPIRVFQIVAAITLLLSFIPDFLLPDTTASEVAALLMLHTIPAVVSVWMLSRLTRSA